MRGFFKLAIAFAVGWKLATIVEREKNAAVYIKVKQQIDATPTTAGGVLNIGYIQTDGFTTEIVANMQEATLLTMETARDLIRILKPSLPQNQYFEIEKAEENQLQLV